MPLSHSVQFAGLAFVDVPRTAKPGVKRRGACRVHSLTEGGAPHSAKLSAAVSTLTPWLRAYQPLASAKSVASICVVVQPLCSDQQMMAVM